MASAKDIRVAPINPQDANRLVKRLHYSGSVVLNTQLHLGVFLGSRLEGVMQFGPSTDKRRVQGLVADTPWNGFIELNRMAFSERLPRNSESRALAVAMRMMRQAYPHLGWVLTYADGAQCGDGTIYRAAGFALTGMRKNVTLWANDAGDVVSLTTVTKEKYILANNGASSMAQYKAQGYKPIEGHQLRYMYFLDPTARDRLTVPVLPYSAIAEADAGMYRGQKVSRGK